MSVCVPAPEEQEEGRTRLLRVPQRSSVLLRVSEGSSGLIRVLQGSLRFFKVFSGFLKVPQGPSVFSNVTQGSSRFLTGAAAPEDPCVCVMNLTSEGVFPSPARQARVHKQAGVLERCHGDVYRSGPEECKQQPGPLLSGSRGNSCVLLRLVAAVGAAVWERPRSATRNDGFPSSRRNKGEGERRESPSSAAQGAESHHRLLRQRERNSRQGSR